MLWCRCVVAVPLILLAACTKPNPEVCCLDPDDCALIGVTDAERTCAEGLACVGHACVVPSCSSDGCSAEAPVCDITLDVCIGCTGPNDCDQFDTKVCDTESGSCVQCVEDLDCELATAPVCDGNACRGCRLDSECASGACGDDGACVAEADALYVSPTGTDVGTCARSTPCFQLQFALSKSSATRNHIVMANGIYTYPDVLALNVNTQTTTAAKIVVHGSGSSINISGADGQAMFDLSLPTTLTDLTLGYQTFGRAVVARAPTTLKRMSITSEVGIEVRSNVTAEDLTITPTTGNTRTAIRVETGSLTLKRATLDGGVNGLVAVSGTTVDLENVLVSDTTAVGVDLTTNSATTASLSFVTIVRTGRSATTGTAGLICPNNNTAVKATIVWTPDVGLSPISGCTLASVIAGPTGVVGAANMDPRFVDLAGGDYHLSSNSPAKDLVDAGPGTDFEGEARPRGARFDIGADEATD